MSKKETKCKKCKKQGVLIADNSIEQVLDWYCEKCYTKKLEIPEHFDLKDE